MSSRAVDVFGWDMTEDAGVVSSLREKCVGVF